jgi:uncharacterized protein
MIVETIFSTLDESGRTNFAPMGIVWDEEIVTIRPFKSSDTWRNLSSSGYGVANISDDVLAYVRCALYDAVLPHFPAKVVPGVVFKSACSWREVAVVSQTGTDERAELRCRILFEGRQRDFLGFRRAGNAVIEAAILATRLKFFDRTTVFERMKQYAEIVGKTGDENDRQALQLVHDYMQQRGR